MFLNFCESITEKGNTILEGKQLLINAKFVCERFLTDQLINIYIDGIVFRMFLRNVNFKQNINYENITENSVAHNIATDLRVDKALAKTNCSTLCC